MKFFIINSFRSMVYIAFFAIIIYGGTLGYINEGENLLGRFPMFESGSALTQALDVVLGLVGGWIAASVVCGLIVTLLDIRDDINDRLPDARQDI